ncbi:MAG TPA: asparaginase [Candidatus Limnocylindrales bacterium]|nr:asparaginase [Candidatus Limnocylindrales bacterium]
MPNRTSTSPLGSARAPDPASEAARSQPLVHVLRQGHVESVHLGHAAGVDAGGRLVFRMGDPGIQMFPRSSFKPFQALPLVESGAFARSGLGPDALAIIAGSHSGTDAHAALVRVILERAGTDESALRCGTHPPYDEATAAALVARGEAPGPLRHNCSGKHAGMLLFARALRAPLDGYLDPDHPVQRAIVSRFAELMGEPEPPGPPAIDGCSAPTPRMPLSTLAHAFALLAAGRDAAGRPVPALAEIREAMRSHPVQVAGEGRLDTRLMRASPRLVTKAGAEAVHATGVVGDEIGIAIKVGDGSRRALAPAVIAVLAEAGALDGAAVRALADLAAERLTNHAGIEVGAIRAVARLAWEAT